MPSSANRMRSLTASAWMAGRMGGAALIVLMAVSARSWDCHRSVRLLASPRPKLDDRSTETLPGRAAGWATIAASHANFTPVAARPASPLDTPRYRRGAAGGHAGRPRRSPARTGPHAGGPASRRDRPVLGGSCRARARAGTGRCRTASGWTLVAGRSPPAGAVALAIRADAVSVAPAGAIAWYPGTPPLPESPASAFAAVEVVEYQSGDLRRALALASRLAIRDGAAIRAGALLRQARILRKMGRPADAAATYRQMADITGAAIEGVPADLVARKALCDAAAGDDRQDATRADAARLEADLDAGRWRLDRATYELVASRLDEWLGRERHASCRTRVGRRGGRVARGRAQQRPRRRDPHRHHRRWRRRRGMERLGRTTGRIRGAPGLRRTRMAAGRTPRGKPGSRCADRAIPILAPHEALSSPGATTATRTAAETGLPWTVAATLPSGTDIDPFGGRRAHAAGRPGRGAPARCGRRLRGDPVAQPRGRVVTPAVGLRRGRLPRVPDSADGAAPVQRSAGTTTSICPPTSAGPITRRRRAPPPGSTGSSSRSSTSAAWKPAAAPTRSSRSTPAPW